MFHSHFLCDATEQKKFILDFTFDTNRLHDVSHYYFKRLLCVFALHFLATLVLQPYNTQLLNIKERQPIYQFVVVIVSFSLFKWYCCFNMRNRNYLFITSREAGMKITEIKKNIIHISLISLHAYAPICLRCNSRMPNIIIYHVCVLWTQQSTPQIGKVQWICWFACVKYGVI